MGWARGLKASGPTMVRTAVHRLGRFLGLHCAFAARRAGVDAAVAWDGQRSGEKKRLQGVQVGVCISRLCRHLPPSAPRAAGKCTRGHLTWAILWWRLWRPTSHVVTRRHTLSETFPAVSLRQAAAVVAQRTAVDEGLGLAPDTAGAGAAFGVRCRFRWSSDSSVVLEPVGFGARV